MSEDLAVQYLNTFAKDHETQCKLLVHEFREYLSQRKAQPGVLACSDVYNSAAAFQAFCDGGGNVPLYVAVSEALRQVHKSSRDELGRPINVLDIGVGHGRALIPTLAGITSNQYSSVTLVEPESGMLKQCVSECSKLLSADAIKSHCETVQQFVAKNDTEHFDIVESSFAMQNLAKVDRVPILKWLSTHSRKFCLVEFDLTAIQLPIASVDSASELFEKYNRGLLEYENSPGFKLVSQGFLMPMLLNCFSNQQSRINYEQTAHAWVNELRDAGFVNVKLDKLYPYWWSDCFLVTAS